MWLNRTVLGISPEEATFSRRGFEDTAPAKRSHLENIGRTFIAGYLSSLDASDVHLLAHRLHQTPAEFRGFAFEGAAMGLALTDHVWGRRRSRFRQFLEGPAATHRYMLYVGHGWAVARIPWLRRSTERLCRKYDPYLGWLIVDGYGFHEGYFHWRSAVTEMRVPRTLSGCAARVFDQGLGRSLWFVNGANIDRIAACVNRFAPERRPDLWSGIGLAATYAGGVNEDELSGLLHLAGEHRSHLAQGAAFAAKARYFAGIQTPYTELACGLFCGMSASQAALLTDSALAALPSEAAAGQQYEAWRSEIRAQLANTRITASLST